MESSSNKHRKLKTKPTRTLVVGYWLPVCVWMTTIFILSSQHKVTVSNTYWLNFLFFKTLHVIEYAILFTLSYRAWAASMPGRRTLWGKFALLIVATYALSDEFHQLFVPSREGAVRDVIIDMLGAGLIWFYLSKKLPKAPKKLRTWASFLDIPY